MKGGRREEKKPDNVQAKERKRGKVRNLGSGGGGERWICTVKYSVPSVLRWERKKKTPQKPCKINPKMIKKKRINLLFKKAKRLIDNNKCKKSNKFENPNFPAKVLERVPSFPSRRTPPTIMAWTVVNSGSSGSLGYAHPARTMNQGSCRLSISPSIVSDLSFSIGL